MLQEGNQVGRPASCILVLSGLKFWYESWSQLQFSLVLDRQLRSTPLHSRQLEPVQIWWEVSI
jgi:hypothetical protein